MSKQKREEVKSCVTWTQWYPNQSGVPAARASRSFEQHTQDKAGQGGQTIDLETSPLTLSPRIYQNLQVSHLHGWVLSSCQLVNKKWTCFCFSFFSFFCSYLYCIQFFQDTGIQWHWHNCNIRHAGSQSFDELRVRSQLHPCNRTIPQSHRPNCIVLQKMSCLYLQNNQHTSSGTRGRQGHARPSLHCNLYMRK